jgi:hypothetical protein
MSIFHTIGRLTYKTKRLVQDSAVLATEPVKAIREGYSEAKATQAEIDEATKLLANQGIKVTSDTFKPRQGEMNI